MDNVHYFYFAVELGVRPISDVEPVRVISKLRGDRIALTRVHFNVLVMWINPTIVEIQNKKLPLTKFLKGSHTPLVLSEDFQFSIKKIQNKQHKWWEQFQYWLGWTYLRLFLNSESFNLLDKKTYGDRVVTDKTYIGQYRNAEIRFDLNFLQNTAMEIAIIGNRQDVDNTLKNIKNEDHDELTVEAIKRFLEKFSQCQVDIKKVEEKAVKVEPKREQENHESPEERYRLPWANPPPHPHEKQDRPQ